ncbi:hypothetical protein CTI12_AA598000 [Artemisia annua]|uniref:Uncharacterized protein n=1 Tax=Artemisia annua TaxID=35608 RepID=A0A2U1KIN9_ARTAN|nr:hypothetical protein CTI12_AA598000 [Artemisia annua]
MHHANIHIKVHCRTSFSKSKWGENGWVRQSMDWKERYPRTLDYSAIVLWVLKTTDLAAAAIAAKSAVVAGTGVRAASTRGAIALGATVAAAGLTVVAVGAAVAGGVAANKGAGKDAPAAKL